MQPIGRKRWSIAEGYIPSRSSFSERALISHETACILNAGDQVAHVSIRIDVVNERVDILRCLCFGSLHCQTLVQESFVYLGSGWAPTRLSLARGA